jgi:integrase/recombinase XerC
LINQFIQHLTNKGYSPHTIAGYSSALHQFANFTAINPDIKAWNRSLQGKPASINLKIAAIKSYYAFCIKHKYLDVNPAKDIAFRKKSARLPGFNVSQTLLSESQINSLSHEELTALTLLSETGIRLSELCFLKRNDIASRFIKVCGKGNKERIVPISDKMSAMLVKLMGGTRGESPQPCFPDQSDLAFRLKPHQVQYLCKKYLGHYPHRLRHTFATTLINAGAPLLSIKELLGHSSVAATQIYTHLDYERLKAVHSKCHPKP